MGFSIRILTLFLSQAKEFKIKDGSYRVKLHKTVLRENRKTFHNYPSHNTYIQIDDTSLLRNLSISLLKVHK